MSAQQCTIFDVLDDSKPSADAPYSIPAQIRELSKIQSELTESLRASYRAARSLWESTRRLEPQISDHSSLSLVVSLRGDDCMDKTLSATCDIVSALVRSAAVCSAPAIFSSNFSPVDLEAHFWSYAGVERPSDDRMSTEDRMNVVDRLFLLPSLGEWYIAAYREFSGSAKSLVNRAIASQVRKVLDPQQIKRTSSSVVFTLIAYPCRFFDGCYDDTQAIFASCDPLVRLLRVLGFNDEQLSLNAWARKIWHDRAKPITSREAVVDEAHLRVTTLKSKVEFRFSLALASAIEDFIDENS